MFAVEIISGRKSKVPNNKILPMLLVNLVIRQKKKNGMLNSKNPNKLPVVSSSSISPFGSVKIGRINIMNNKIIPAEVTILRTFSGFLKSISHILPLPQTMRTKITAPFLGRKGRDSSKVLAEEQGFEPWIRLRGYRFSRAAH